MIDLASIPEQMRAERRWLVWRYDAHQRKIPFQAVDPSRTASSSDPTTWCDFDAAIAALARGQVDGVGFALGDGWAGVDLDNCIDDSGAISAFAGRIVADLDSYTEVSPSGVGLKVFVRGSLASAKRAGLEIYASGRYFTVTGRHVEGTPTSVEERTDALLTLISREFDMSPGVAPQAGAQTIAQGARNNHLASLAGSMRRRHMSEQAILAALRVENARRCSPPLPDREVEAIARSVARYEPQAGAFPLTEAGDAEHFAAAFGDRVRFDHRRGRWLIFAGHRWIPDADGELYRLALDAIRQRQRQALAVQDSDERKRQLAWGISGESRKRIENMLALARSYRPISDDGNNWDTDLWLFGVENGVVDLRTGDLRDGKPEDRITMSARSPYDPAAVCPLWTQTIEEVFGGDCDLVGYVQRAFGYCLTGDCSEECLFLCWGGGANGKGTLMNTVGWILGDYADDLPFSALELHDRAGIPNDVAKLVGRRFVTASETSEVRLNEARVKALTGRDPITARFLHREFFTFQPMAKFCLATNRKPIVRDDSDGFWRRIHLLPFTQSFIGRENKALKDLLREEAPGILAWLMYGCLAWRRDGLRPPVAVLNATGEYRLEQRQLDRFIEARCEISDGTRVQAGSLFAAYKRWCEVVRERPDFNHKTIGVEMRKRFQVDSNDKRHTWYLGIALRASGSFDDAV